MGKSAVAILAVVVALGFGAWARVRREQDARAALSSISTSPPASPSTPTSAPTWTSTPPPPTNPANLPTEDALMARLRSADPATVLALVREGKKRFPDGAGAEEREARRIDALVALDRIGEAHTHAMIFVQHHPSGPFSQHVMNLLGVHPRPPGAVPEPPPDSE